MTSILRLFGIKCAKEELYLYSIQIEYNGNPDVGRNNLPIGVIMGNEGIKILLVEDNEPDVEPVLRLLEKASNQQFEITTVKRLQSAMEDLRKKRYEIVLLDLKLPDNKGVATFDAIKRECPDIPVVIFTVAGNEEAGIEAIIKGAQDYLVKGTSDERIISKSIRYAIERKRLEIEQRHTNEKLRESEERFRILVTTTSDVLYRMSPDWSSMHELHSERLLASTEKPTRSWFQDYILPEEQAYVNSIINKSIETKTTFELEHRVVRADGKIGWVFSRAVPVLNGNGEIKEWFGAAVDITTRKQIEESLRESEERYRNIFSNAAMGIIEYDSKDNFVAVNDYVCQILGYTRDEIIGKNVVDITAPQDRERTITMNALIQEGKANRFTYEKRYLRSDGTLLWAHVTVSAIRDEHGKHLLSIGTIEDISEQRQAREALRESEERFRTVFDSNMIAIAFWTTNGTLTDANQAFCDLIGCSVEEVRSGRKKWVDFTPADMLWRDQQGIDEINATGVCQPYEKKIIHRDGQIVPILIGGASMGGIKDQGVAFAIDLSAQKEVERALYDREQRYSKLFNNKTIGIAHCRTITDKNGKTVDFEILEVNDAYTTITGIKKENIEGRRAREVFPGIENYSFDYIGNYGKIALEGGELNFEDYFVALRQWLSIYVYSPFQGEFVSIFTDISARKHTEEALKKSENDLKILNENLENIVGQRTLQVRSLSRALALSEQRERKRFSKLLHEDLQQVLFALKLQINFDTAGQKTIQIESEEVNESKRLLDKALKITQNLALELNPPILKGEDLQAAIGWLSSHMKNTYGLTVNLGIKTIPDITEDIQIMIVQVVRELLSNVSRHSGVEIADVLVETQQENLIIKVSDKGKGFDVASVKKMIKRVGYGLFAIEERLRLFGGELDIISTPGSGTSVTLIIPLQNI
jgi:PAS domain S-box-containing protein